MAFSVRFFVEVDPRLTLFKHCASILSIQNQPLLLTFAVEPRLICPTLVPMMPLAVARLQRKESRVLHKTRGPHELYCEVVRIRDFPACFVVQLHNPSKESALLCNIGYTCK